MTDNNVVQLKTGNMTADELLEECKGNFKDFVIMGWGEDGFMATALTSGISDAGALLHVMELFKLNLMTGMYSAENN